MPTLRAPLLILHGGTALPTLGALPRHTGESLARCLRPLSHVYAARNFSAQFFRNLHSGRKIQSSRLGALGKFQQVDINPVRGSEMPLNLASAARVGPSMGVQQWEARNSLYYRRQPLASVADTLATLKTRLRGPGRQQPLTTRCNRR